MSSYVYQQKTALVTGASSGIGEAFATFLAQRCENVILVARPSERLQEVAIRLCKQANANIHVLPADLTKPGAVEALRAECESRGWHVDIVVNNAGLGSFGRFDELSADTDAGMIRLNVLAVCDIAHAFLPGMLSRRDGVLINTASSAALIPTPWFAVYGATKAFVLSLSESLWALYRSHGVRVCAVCPGPVDTGFFDKTQSNINTVKVFQRRITVESVVESAMRSVDEGHSVALCDWPTRIQHFLIRFSPRSVVARVSEKMMRPLNYRPER
jgi:short-subunit dehydrogenase